MDSKQYLQEVSQQFARDTSFLPVLSAELECYLSCSADISILLRQIFFQCDIAEQIKQEEGQGQYEVTFLPTSDPLLLAQTITHTRQTIETLATSYHTSASFKAKPFEYQPASGLHFHVNLLDAHGNNLFCNDKNNQESQTMLYAIGGLLETMPAAMKYFCPHKEDYQRFEAITMDTPRTVSWGGNNRTVALRLPTTTGAGQHRRIEHRLPSPTCNPYEALSALLLGIKHGLEHRILPTLPKIYGNANDEQYHLSLLPLSLTAARQQHHSALECVPTI